MQEEPKHYEMTLIIPGSIAEDQHSEVLKGVKSILEKSEAQITKTSDMGRKKLAYAINHLRHGFYFTYEFNLMPKLLKTVENDLKLNKDILRFLTVKKRIITEEEKAQEEKKKVSKVKAQIKKQEQEEEKEKIKEKPVKQKISLEDLDKKLDELLDDNVL